MKSLLAECTGCQALQPGLQGYASRTGTVQNLRALRAAGWRLIVSATGVLCDQGFRFGLDNGAWTAFQQHQPFDSDRFLRALDRFAERADWIVIPDVVAGGLASLEFSIRWLQRLRDVPGLLLLAVQDGMQPADVRPLLQAGRVGIFIGGSDRWKENTAVQWGVLARERNVYLHVGRVNSQRRIRICHAAGAHSFDGTSPSRYRKTLPTLDAARRQPDLFGAAP